MKITLFIQYFSFMFKKAGFITILIIFVACGADKRKNDRDRFFLLGNEALKKKEYKEAIRQYSEALALDGEYADAYNNRGIAYLKRGDAGNALLDINQALLIKEEVPYLWNRAEAYAALNRYDKATADIAEVRNAFPDSAAVYFSEGLIHFQFQKLPEAEAAFSEALSRDSANGEIFINRGTVRFYRDKFDEAEQDLKKGLELMPEEANAWNTLALLEAEKENLSQALSLIEKALDISPNEAYFLNNKGYVLLKMDRMEEAAKAIDTSLLIDPQNAWAYRNKGIYLYATGQYDEAVRLLEKAYEMDQRVEDTPLWLGRAYLALGNKQKACENFEKADDSNELLVLKSQHCSK